MNEQGDTLRIVGPKNQFPEVSLMEPGESGYLLLAAEVDHRPPVGFFIQSGRKTRLIQSLKTLLQTLRNNDEVIEASVFKALIAPPNAVRFLISVLRSKSRDLTL